MTNSRKTGRTCSTCSVGIFDQSKSGRCRTCNLLHANTNPELNKRRAETVRNRCKTDPSYRARKVAVMNRNRDAAIAANPEKWTGPDNVNRLLSYITCPKWQANRKAALVAFNKRDRLPWLPNEYRAQYRDMTRSLKFSAPEAKAIILDDIARKEARLSPFERQERALAQGGKLIANDAAPSPYAAQAKWNVG